jgi:hypothetical protein
MELTVEFHPQSEELSLPYFRPAEAAPAGH